MKHAASLLCDRCEERPIVDWCCVEHGQVLCAECLRKEREVTADA